MTFAISANLMAQQAPQSPAQEFAPGVVSTGDGFSVTFMPDGRDVYFTARDRASIAAKPPLHIYHSHFERGAWQPATAAEFSSQEWSDLDPFIAPDGRRLYFVSTRPVAEKDAGKRDMDIWYSEMHNSAWGEPHWIVEVNSTAKEGSPSVDAHNNLYFFSDRGAEADHNSIYLARWVDKHFSAPEKLAAEVNAGPSDTSPLISPDGKTLLFYSTRPGGYGQADLYVSFLKHGKWSTAKNLGPVVNTDAFEYNPSVSRDGRIFYFGRDGKIYFLPLNALHVWGLNPRRFRLRRE